MVHFFIERDGSFMPAFASYSDGLLCPVNVPLPQARAFAGTNAGPVEQAQQRSISEPQNRVAFWMVQQFADFLPIQRYRQLARRRLDFGEVGHWVLPRLQVAHSN